MVVLRAIPSYQRDELFRRVAIAQIILTKEAFWINGETSPSYKVTCFF